METLYAAAAMMGKDGGEPADIQEAKKPKLDRSKAAVEERKRVRADAADARAAKREEKVQSRMIRAEEAERQKTEKRMAKAEERERRLAEMEDAKLSARCAEEGCTKKRCRGSILPLCSDHGGYKRKQCILIHCYPAFTLDEF